MKNTVDTHEVSFSSVVFGKGYYIKCGCYALSVILMFLVLHFVTLTAPEDAVVCVLIGGLLLDIYALFSCFSAIRVSHQVGVFKMFLSLMPSFIFMVYMFMAKGPLFRTIGDALKVDMSGYSNVVSEGHTFEVDNTDTVYTVRLCDYADDTNVMLVVRSESSNTATVMELTQKDEGRTLALADSSRVTPMGCYIICTAK